MSDRPEGRPVPSLARASARNARTSTAGRTDGRDDRAPWRTAAHERPGARRDPAGGRGRRAAPTRQRSRCSRNLILRDARAPPHRGRPARLAASLPGLPPPPHRPLADPQLRSDHRGRRPLLESPSRFQPDLLPVPSALGGQPAAFAHTACPCLFPDLGAPLARTTLPGSAYPGDQPNGPLSALARPLPPTVRVRWMKNGPCSLGSGIHISRVPVSSLVVASKR